MLRNFYVKQLFADTTISKEVEKILKGSLDSINPITLSENSNFLWESLHDG